MAVVTAAASLSTTAGFVATASPAEADASDCPSGAACIWEDTWFKTDGHDTAYVAFWLQIPDYSGWWYYEPAPGVYKFASNNATSVSSNGNDCRYKAYFFHNVNYNGQPIGFERNTGDANLDNDTGNAGRWYDDTIESGRFSQVRSSC